MPRSTALNTIRRGTTLAVVVTLAGVPLLLVSTPRALSQLPQLRNPYWSVLPSVSPLFCRT